jgi:hypothetical protein
MGGLLETAVCLRGVKKRGKWGGADISYWGVIKFFKFKDGVFHYIRTQFPPPPSL